MEGAAPVKLTVDSYVAAALRETLKLDNFFPEFTVEHVEKIFPGSGLYGYPSEAVVIVQGEEAKDLFIVYTGEVKILQEFGGAIAEVARLGPGSIIGEIALLQKGARTATAVAGIDSQIFRLSYDDFKYILANNHELYAHLSRLVSERMGR